MNVRRILIALAVAFTAFMVARGLWWSTPVSMPEIFVAASVGYAIVAALCIFIPSRPDGKLPHWVTAAAVLVACTVPSAVEVAMGSLHRHEPFSIWYLGGIGSLMTIVMARRRPLAAWLGMAALAVASGCWLGPAQSLALGLVGSLMWVVVAQLLVWSLDRAERDAAAFAAMQRSVSAWQAAQLTRRRERRIHVRRALQVAGPTLTETVATGGNLSAAQRIHARVAEGTLRDEIRGARLLNDQVRAELERARRNGAIVTVFDEGGIDDLDEVALAQVRADLAEILRDADSQRLYIRACADPFVAVTVVGRSEASSGLPEHDGVELWREIPRPRQR